MTKFDDRTVRQVADYVADQQANGWPGAESIHSAHGKPKGGTKRQDGAYRHGGGK